MRARFHADRFGDDDAIAKAALDALPLAPKPRGDDPSAWKCLAVDSNVYLNLILREKAKLETDPVIQQELIAEAVRYQDKAKEIVQKRKAQAATAGS